MNEARSIYFALAVTRDPKRKADLRKELAEIESRKPRIVRIKR